MRGFKRFLVSVGRNNGRVLKFCQLLAIFFETQDANFQENLKVRRYLFACLLEMCIGGG